MPCVAKDRKPYPYAPLSIFDDEIFRIVESQEEVATTNIVANLDEQHLLEQLIETSKPGAIGTVPHYLLSTPFRYPPLKHGSRFGQRFEASLFCGSLEQDTCFLECAYYRFLLIDDMTVPPPEPVMTQHTVFTARVASHAAVDLRQGPYNAWQDELRSPTSYHFSQPLGSNLRDQGAEMLLFTTARGEAGSNVGLYTPEVFSTNQPTKQEPWTSQVVRSMARFSRKGVVLHFNREQFSGPDDALLRVS
jgi:hypothetical protein